MIFGTLLLVVEVVVVFKVEGVGMEGEGSSLVGE